MSYKLKTECSACGGEALDHIMDYGDLPLAGDFPQKRGLDSVETYPLALLFCPKCKLVQASGSIKPEVLFKDYRYLSSVGLGKYFQDTANYLTKVLGLTPHHRIVEIGSNDGAFLVPMMELGLSIIGFEPSDNVSKVAVGRGCNIKNDYFSFKIARRHFMQGSVDAMFAANCLAHIDKINDVVQGMNYCLKDGGVAVIEVHNVKSLVEEMQYDFVYHEHAFYYSVTSLMNLFARHGMTVVNYEEIPIHSGSLRVFVYNGRIGVPEKIHDRVMVENKTVADLGYFRSFTERACSHRRSLITLLNDIKYQNKKIIGYGASGRGNTLCNFCNINTSLVDYIVDESKERQNRYIPIQNIPIKEKKHFDNDKDVDYVLVFAWNFSRMIMEKLKDRDVKFIIPFPEPRIVSSIEELDGNIGL